MITEHQRPLVSVVMTVFNEENHVRAAVDSILEQSYPNVELIIIDDGSTDRTGSVIDSYAGAGVRVVHQENRGIAHSANRGLRLAQGEYIARLDADDLCLPDRFTKQVAFLETHPEVGLLGCGCLIRDEVNGVEWEFPVIENHDALIRQFIKGNPIIHSSIMMRKSLLDAIGGYDESYPFSLDFALYITLGKYTRLAQIPDVLVVHREHPGALTARIQRNLKGVFRYIRMGLHHRWRVYRRFDFPLWCVILVPLPILHALMEQFPGFFAMIKRCFRIGQKNQRVI